MLYTLPPLLELLQLLLHFGLLKNPAFRDQGS